MSTVLGNHKEVILSIVWEYRGIVSEIKKAESEGMYSVAIDDEDPMILPLLEKSILDLMRWANRIIDAHIEYQGESV
jgi:hypothetical protein